MSSAFISDKASLIKSENIMDSITSTNNRTTYLKGLLANIGGDSSYITDSNSDAIFTTLNTHRLRVEGDGGTVLSLARTLNAFVFARKNSITDPALYSAYSANFGYKKSGTSVIKVYD